jgi:hypothetical protein
MAGGSGRSTIIGMTPPSTPALSRLVLLGEPRTEREQKIRRYRLARLKLEPEMSRSRGATRETERHAHLRRSYD